MEETKSKKTAPIKKKGSSIGVIIGRFQVPYLHDAHKQLFDRVLGEHNKVLVFLGVAPVLGTPRNPLDFDTRKKMLFEEYGNKIVVHSVPDMNNDEEWSKELDKRIREIYHIGDVLLYGGRDSFINHYKGKFETTELEQDIYISGSIIREDVAHKVLDDLSFRAGLVYAANNRWKHVHPTVDIAPFNDDESKILLCRKAFEDKYRFIGGFADTTDSSYETTVTREYEEETGGEIGDIRYYGSALVTKDWRYQREDDKIMTILYLGKHLFGPLTPKDDIVELRWFDMNFFIKEGAVIKNIVPEHSSFVASLVVDYVNGKFKSKPDPELLTAPVKEAYEV